MIAFLLLGHTFRLSFHQVFIGYFVGVSHRRIDLLKLLPTSKLVHQTGIVLGLGCNATVGHLRVTVFSLKQNFIFVSLDSLGFLEKAIKITCVSESKGLGSFSSKLFYLLLKVLFLLFYNISGLEFFKFCGVLFDL